MQSFGFDAVRCDCVLLFSMRLSPSPAGADQLAPEVVCAGEKPVTIFRMKEIDFCFYVSGFFVCACIPVSQFCIKLKCWKGQRLTQAYHPLSGRRRTIAGINSDSSSAFFRDVSPQFARMTTVIRGSETNPKAHYAEWQWGISDSVIETLPAAKLARLLSAQRGRRGLWDSALWAQTVVDLVVKHNRISPWAQTDDMQIGFFPPLEPCVSEATISCNDYTL